MAGLLDFLGTDSGQLGLGLLAAAAPSMAPMNFAGRLAQGMQNYQGMQYDQTKKKYLDAQAQNLQDMADARRAALVTAAAQRAALPGLFGVQSALAPNAVTAPIIGGAQPNGDGTTQQEDPSQALQPQTSQGSPIGQFDVIGALKAGYTPKEITDLAALRNVNSNEVARTIKGIGPNGVEQEYQYDKYGNKIGTGLDQYRPPIQVNQGNKTTFADPYSLQPLGQFQTFQSPDSAASNATTRRGQDMTDARAAAQDPIGAATGAAGGVHGDAYLGTVPTNIAAQVKALAEGRMAFPSGYALKSPYWQQMLSMVSQYDPSFDAINYNARAKTRSDFTSGKSAQNLNAFNTVLGHLDSLVTTGNALNNGSFPLVNKIENYALDASGDPRPKQFDANKKAVVDELTRAWRGNGGSEADIKSWSDAITNSASPAQLSGVAHQIAELLTSKINAMGEQYNQGMGTSKNGIQLLTPQSQKILQKFNGDAVPATATPASTNKVVDALPVANGSNKGQRIRDTATGKILVSDGIQWRPQ